MILEGHLLRNYDWKLIWSKTKKTTHSIQCRTWDKWVWVVTCDVRIDATLDFISEISIFFFSNLIYRGNHL